MCVHYTPFFAKKVGRDDDGIGLLEGSVGL
jgi:hypothetical protein